MQGYATYNNPIILYVIVYTNFLELLNEKILWDRDSIAKQTSIILHALNATFTLLDAIILFTELPNP